MSNGNRPPRARDRVTEPTTTVAKRLRKRIADRAQAAPSARQWDAMRASLFAGDALMDAVVDWMIAHGVRATKPLFDAAVERGIASVADAPDVLRALFARVDAPPPWLDRARLDAGARFCGLAGRVGLDVLRDGGLLPGYLASAVNRTLVKGPQKRVAETTKWWIDCTRPGGMARFADGWKTTLQVRLIHAFVRRHVGQMPEWQAAIDGIPVNQGDMNATNLVFSAQFLLGQRALGVIVTKSEGADVMHLWRYIGWLLGIDEQWLHDTEDAARIALYQNLLSQPPPDETSRQLGAALADEPLQRHYARFPRLRGYWNRARHVSIARLFLAANEMRALGLSRWTLPWYPLLTWVPRFSWHALHRLIPGGRERLIRRGLASQQQYLDVLFGGDERRVTAAPVVNRLPVHSTVAK
jgi:uncharacterized protein CbrC (UPF0167 family)